MSDIIAPARGIFRAIWPVTDPGMPLPALMREALSEVAEVAARARVELLDGPVQCRVLSSKDVPGSGNLTDSVLVYECPARALPPRPYHRRSA